MTGKYLLSLCKAKITKPLPKAIIVRYRPFVEEELIGIDHDFRELVKGTIYEKLNIIYKAGRSGGYVKHAATGEAFYMPGSHVQTAVVLQYALTTTLQSNFKSFPLAMRIDNMTTLTADRVMKSVLIRLPHLGQPHLPPPPLIGALDHEPAAGAVFEGHG